MFIFFSKSKKNKEKNTKLKIGPKNNLFQKRQKKAKK